MIRVPVSIFVAALLMLAARASAYVATAPVPLQPLAQQAHQIENALAYLGQPLSPEEISRIDEAVARPNESDAVAGLQKVLDTHVLALVQINAESRVKVEAGPAQPELVEAGTRLFLIKVINDAGVTAQLNVESPNSGDVYIQSTGSPQPAMELTPRKAADRWADVSLYPLPATSWASISLYQNPPMLPRLSGLAVEYQILAIYSRDAGQRSAIISFNVGQGSQEIGFRNDMTVLFTARPAHPITFRVRDESGQPAMASFIIRDKLNRLYPNPAKRLAPDFFFQPQVYREDGEVSASARRPIHDHLHRRPRVSDTSKRIHGRWHEPVGNAISSWSAGSIRQNTAGIREIITFTPRVAGTIRIRRRVCFPTT